MPAQFLNILLQKSDPKLSWGFDIVGGREYGLPLTICQVSSNSFSSQYLSKGDEIVQIDGFDASLFTEAEALRFIKKPSKSLDLVVLKRSKEDPQTAKTPRFQKLASSEKSKSIQNASAEKISKRRLISEKKTKNYKRSSSVPSKYSYCGVPTYQLHYTVPDVDTNQRVNSIRDRSESPTFWRNNQNNAARKEAPGNTRSSRVFWRQMETGCTDTECDKEVAQYCRSRRDRWKARSNSIDSTVSAENTSTTSTQTTYTETSQKYKYKMPVQFDYYEHRDREQHRSRVSDVECDKEVAQYSRSRRDRWKVRSSSIDSSSNVENISITTAQSTNTETSQEYRYKIPVSFDYNEHREREKQQRRVNFVDQQKPRQRNQTNVSKAYLSPYDLKMQKDIILSLQPLRTARGRQTSQTSEKGPQAQTSCESTPGTAVPNNCSNAAAPPAPPAPAPPPPPPPAMNGTIPTIRLKSEISDRCEPPAKIQNAMMKDKKPFTYTPGGIDLSEIKSPRMQRRIMNNAQTPDDIILPTPTPHVNPNTLPPSAVAAMTPQIAIPVFPQNGLPKKPSHHVNPPHTQSPQMQPVAPSPPPPQPPKQTMTPPPPPQRRSVSPTPMQQNQQPGRTIVVTNSQPSPTPVQQNQQPGRTVVVTNSQSSPVPQHPPSRTILVNSQPNQPPQQQQNQQPVRTIVITNSQQDKPKDQPRAQVGSIYVPPVTNETVQNNSKPSFPVLREAPTPWLQKNQAQEDKTPAWVNRNKNIGEGEQKEIVYERKPRVQQVQNEKEFSDSDKPVAGTRVIPIQIEGSNQTNSKASSQRWGTPVSNNQTVLSNQNNVNRGSVANTNKSFNEPDSKPIQSRSFKVIQRITGSEDDNVDYSSEVPYNTENEPLSQLRRLQFCDDDQAFMNKVKSQVDEDIFLHSETDPRYRGSAIPSKAFRKLQNMTDSGQVIPITIEVQAQEKARPAQTQAKDTNDEPQKKYIPPSERQAEQDLRKYMGSSIPSRSFRMLQAMTSTQPNSQHTKRIDNIDEDARFLYPNPWPDPPKSVDEIGPFWIDYSYLYNLVLKYFPRELYPDFGDLEDESSGLKTDLDDSVSDFHRDEYSENETKANSSENLPNEAGKEELIIDEVVKDDSDHEVSLTICIPLRRKSKSVEYHEEVTIKGHGEVTKENPITSSESPIVELDTPAPLESPKTSMEADTGDKHLESLDSKQPSSSDTEHSESSSVDFWKDIATDEDVYFKRSVTPGAEPHPRSSAYEDTTDEDGCFKPHSTSLGSQICDEVTIDNDGYFQSRPKTPGLGSAICDELDTNQNGDFDSIPTKYDYDELAAEEDRYFNSRKSAIFGRLSESLPWFQTNTDEDGNFQSRPKTPGLDRNSRSPSICDELTTNQDSKSIPTGLDFEEPLESANCDDLTAEQDRFFVSRPKTPGFGRRSVSPPWDWDEINNDEDEHFKSTEEDFNSNRYQESANYDEDFQPKSRPKTPGPKSPPSNQSENTPEHPNCPEPGQDPWNLGQDIKNYCEYTSMDSESSSSSSGSAEDLDEPFENSSNSSSSDENDSYNVYEFSTNPAPPSEPPKPPTPEPPEIHQTPVNDRDDDSGMSDTGKCIPEPEPLGTELRKLTKYQRANTHSRLLRILQEEEDKRSGKSELTVRKESLTLPLAPNPWLTESVSSSSGINSPLSPVMNEKLVNELVQSLLNSKGLGYHKLPAEKLREAAIKSLYESCSDTSRACSPYNCSTDKSKLTGQDGDTSQTDCYDSYDENSAYYPGFDIFPSRAFKNLQSGRSTPLNWPKCPLLPTQSPDPANPNTLNSTQDATHDR